MSITNHSDSVAIAIYRGKVRLSDPLTKVLSVISFTSSDFDLFDLI